MEQVSTYKELRKIDVSEHIEKKGNLSYLSWCYAVDVLLQEDPSATWEYKEPAKFGDTMMVFCSVTAFGKTMTAQLPVMDNRNKAISNPDSFAVNTAMQRCLAKAIALHGIGLRIYAGEDLLEEKRNENEAKKAEEAAKESREKAVKWADRAIGELKACEDVKVWISENSVNMHRLNSKHADLWEKVIAAKDKREEELEVAE